MHVTNARYVSADGLSIEAEIYGVTVIIPADPENRHFAALLASGINISPFLAAPPSVSDVRAEASRRMQQLVGARDAAHLELIIVNGTREAVRLLRVRGGRAWTSEEAARAAQLEGVDAAIEAIRAASNALEVMDPIPADYADDGRWP